MEKLWKNLSGFAQLVPMVMAIVITFALLFIGAYVNGEIEQNLTDSLGGYDASGGAHLVDDIYNTTGNISENWDTGIDIVQVVIIITILAGAISAIFLFTRFR